MKINYEYYRFFYYVAKYRNFTQAAAALMNNQPNVTRTIKNLESDLGCTLFIRSNRGVKLTPEGEKLYAHIRIAVEQIEMGEELLSMDRGLRSGVISIGASEVALRCFLLPVLNEFHRLYPGVRLHITNQPTPQPVSALRNGLADLAVVTTPTGDVKSLKVQNVREYREVAVCGAVFSRLKEKPVSLQELSEHSIISLDVHTTTYDFYRKWFAKYGLSFAPDIEVATADQILPMVKNNLGIGFVPEDFLRDEDCRNVFRLDMIEEFPVRSICYIKRADQPLSVAAKELERMIMEYSKEII
ncbi:MAG: LysR family transcriptional regulator [Eubacteriales bacterium]|nr:LysR family transcriptional regulator [Eubacteriales bacterium]